MRNAMVLITARSIIQEVRLQYHKCPSSPIFLISVKWLADIGALCNIPSSLKSSNKSAVILKYLHKKTCDLFAFQKNLWASSELAID